MNIFKKAYLRIKARFFGLSFNERVLLYQRYLDFDSLNACKILRVHFRYHRITISDYDYFNQHHHRLWSLFLKYVSYEMLNNRTVQEQIINYAPITAFTSLNERFDKQGENMLILSGKEDKINWYVKSFQLSSTAINKLIELYVAQKSNFWKVLVGFSLLYDNNVSPNNLIAVLKTDEELVTEIVSRFSMHNLPDDKFIEFLIDCKNYKLLRIILVKSYIKSHELRERIEKEMNSQLDIELYFSSIRLEQLEIAKQKKKHYGITKKTWIEDCFIMDRQYDKLDVFLERSNLTLAFFAWVLHNFPEKRNIIKDKLLKQQYNTQNLSS